MALRISSRLRNQVHKRAKASCEYCLQPEQFSLHKHEPDHIVPVQHGGATDLENLALACFRCNRHKGPNVGSFDPDTGILVPFFNPRKDNWDDHFRLEDGVLSALSPQARVTVNIFKLNDEKRVAERRMIFGKEK